MIARIAGHPIVVDPAMVLRAIRDEAIATPRFLRAWYGFLALLMLVGAVSAVRAIFPGDKGVNTTPTVEWGLLIIGYVFFAITTSGLCLASSLGTVFGIDRFRPLEKRHAVLAVLCLVTAFGVIAIDLHYPVRLLFGAALNPSFSSPMWWMGVFYGIYLCFLLTEVWSIFWHHERIHAVACLLASGMAIIAPSTLGAVFGILAARPYWNGVVTPIQMVASALLSGTALLAIVFYAVARWRLTGFERASALALPAIRSVLVIALVIVASLVAWQIVTGLLSTDPGLSAATDALLSGPLVVPFVGVRVILGLVVPLAILVLPWTRAGHGMLVAGCLAIVGVFADRLTFVSAGQIAPTTAISGVVSAPYATYSPSLVEVGVLLGAVAFVLLLYTLAERYLDLHESEVHVGFSLPLKLGRLWAGPAITAPADETDTGLNVNATDPVATSGSILGDAETVAADAEASPGPESELVRVTDATEPPPIETIEPVPEATPDAPANRSADRPGAEFDADPSTNDRLPEVSEPASMEDIG
jgi:molybdopterin-containing oxidoreductase family membrane subunit